MLPQDEMYRMMSLRYFTKIIKKKKVASYLLEQAEEEVQMSLQDAITLKKDANKME
jgi:hypothetical protein